MISYIRGQNPKIMKKINLLLMLLAFVSTIVHAQSADEKAVAEQVDKLSKALIAADKAVLESLAAEELTYGHSSGTIEDKAAFVDAVVSGKTKYTKVDVSDQTIKIVGDIALVRHNAAMIVNGGNVNLGILLVFRKQRGEWKLLARQAYRR